MEHFNDGGMLPFVNVTNERGEPMPYAGIGEQLAASAVAGDLWIKEAWGDQPLIIKGVHCAEDALKAEELGATGVIFSNHGGRQLGQAIPSLQIVAEVMPKLHAAGSKLDVQWMEESKRTRCSCWFELWAQGCRHRQSGRWWSWSWWSHSTTRAFELVKDLIRSMELLGVQNIRQIHNQGEKLRRESMVLGTAHLPEFYF